MKNLKSITILSLILFICVFALCFNAFNVPVTKTLADSDYSVYNGGIALKDDVNAGVNVTYNRTQGRDQTYGTIYATFGFKLSDVIDASADGNYDGLLIKMANYSDRNVKFVTYLISEDKIGRFATTTAQTYKTFVTDSGVNLADSENGIKWQGSYYIFSAGAVGTYNLDFTDVKSGRPNMNTVSEVVFGLRMDEALNEGVGLTVGSIAAYKQDSDAIGGYSVKMLFKADETTISDDPTDTVSDVNVSDPLKGGKVYMKGCVNGSNAYYDEDADIVNAWALNYLNVSVKKHVITLNYQDENGVILKNPDTVSVYACREYTVTPTAFAGFEYLSANGELTGKATGDLSLTLKYRAVGTVTFYSLTVKYVDGNNKPLKTDDVMRFLSGVDYKIDIPEIRGYVFENANGGLEGTITEDTTVIVTYVKNATKWNVSEIEWDVSRSEDSLYIKGSLYGGIQFINNEQMILIDDDVSTYGRTILGLSKFSFSRAIDAVGGEFDGLLIRIENISDKDQKFSAYLLSGDKIARNFVSADARYEKFVDEKGNPINEWERGISLANNYYTFTPGASGTWNYDFSDLKTGKEDMSAADAFAIGLRQNDMAFTGRGILISSIAAYKYDESYENGYYVETLFNGRDLTVSKIAGDATADVNLVDTDLGRIVNTDLFNTNNTNAWVSEEYRDGLHERTLFNTSYEQRGYMIKLNCYDMDGDLLATRVDNYPSGEQYTVTPIEITNYRFVEADDDLTGTISNDIEINLYYDLVKYTVTVKFHNESGNKIREDWVCDVTAGEYLIVDPTENKDFAVDGYTYKKANNRVKFTVVRNTEVVLIFSRDSRDSGCGSSISAEITPVGCLVLFLAFVIVKNVKKKFSDRQ